MTPRDPGAIANLCDALLTAADKLCFDGEQGEGISTLRWSFISGLKLLAARERGGPLAARDRLRSVGELLHSSGAPVNSTATALIERTLAQSASLEDIEAATVQALALIESTWSGNDQIVSSTGVQALCEWEATEASSHLAARARPVAVQTEIDAPLLCRYLREQLHDDRIEVTECRQLRGGFGKDTYLFSAVGDALSGDFVLRRDTVVNLIANACHRVVKEFPVLQALQQLKFSSPEVLWLDERHEMIPGGNFIVMRRSPGTCGGTLFGAAEPPAPALNDEIGRTVARLHTLPPLTELGALTESIRPELWSCSAADVLRAFLRNFRNVLLTSPHAPSPATVAIFNWLIANVPEDGVRPALIHGDIGFHNLLLEQGHLTALLDWERAHIGHPAEDLAYLRNATVRDLDWPRVMRAYRAAGGIEISDAQLLYFRIMTLARNCISLNVGPSRLFGGETDHLKLLAADHYMRPETLRAIGALIQEHDVSSSNGARAQVGEP